VISLELELRKASDEIAQLREELSAMSNENMQLKVRTYYFVFKVTCLNIIFVSQEEGLRLRRSNISGKDSAGFKPEMPPPILHQSDSVATLSSPNILYIVAALLLGIIIAKLFF
jgi:hypothetical protein